MEQNAFNYEVIVTWDKERRGRLLSPELPDLEVATPPEFPKGHHGIWSPEHYFVAAVNGCFMTSFLAVADASGLHFRSFACKGTGLLKKEEGKYMITEVSLFPKIEIEAQHDKERTERIVHKAETLCLISNSVKSVITVHPEIVLADKEITPAA